MPTEYNLEFWRGNDETRTFTFKQSDGSAFDLTGSTLVFRLVDSTETQVIRKELTIATPTNGEAVLTLSETETRSIPKGSTNYYEIERRISATQTTLMYGTVTGSGGFNDD